MTNTQHYVFIDESGDPGRPFKIYTLGNKIQTGASILYILTAIYLDSVKLFVLENEIMDIRQKYGFRSEIKSTTIPLEMYKYLLGIINKIGVPVYYRLIDKTKYKGKFAVSGHAKLHNIFDDYNLSKLVLFTAQKQDLIESEVIIDRADRRMFKGDCFNSFDKYLFGSVNTIIIKRIKHITHVNSEYVNAMQLSDVVSGAVKDYFTGKNKDLIKIIDKKHIYKIW